MEGKKFAQIYFAGKLYEAELVVGLLAENGIEAAIVNKRDSEFLIGEVEVHVAEEDVERAKEILAKRGE
ncbi:MAG: DUF2007 domain-containing protein [Bacteroidales bacterium]|jgi:hypothetical protein|nr:DUF2007 domain-containing protein [Bacteroidales bacterium]